MNDEYRIENKRNVHKGGHRTSFQYFTRQGDAFIHRGAFTAPGWNATDEKCARAAQAVITEAEEDDVSQLEGL